MIEEDDGHNKFIIRAIVEAIRVVMSQIWASSLIVINRQKFGQLLNGFFNDSVSALPTPSYQVVF